MNGTVAAVAQAFQDGSGPVGVSFLVPEEAFEPGSNDVSVYRVSGSEANPTLIGLQTNLTE